jgi:hypothetical protein
VSDLDMGQTAPAPDYYDVIDADRADALMLGLVGDDPATCRLRLQRARDIVAEWNAVADAAYAAARWSEEPNVVTPFATHLLIDHGGHVGDVVTDPRFPDVVYKGMGGPGQLTWGRPNNDDYSMVANWDGEREIVRIWKPSDLDQAAVETECSRLADVAHNQAAQRAGATPSGLSGTDPGLERATRLEQAAKAPGYGAAHMPMGPQR